MKFEFKRGSHNKDPDEGEDYLAWGCLTIFIILLFLFSLSRCTF